MCDLYRKSPSWLNTSSFQLCGSNCVPLYVAATGSVKSNIEASRYKCSGNVKVKFEDQWLPVCQSALTDTKTLNTICEEMKCGEHLELVDYFGPPRADNRVISELLFHQTDNNTNECLVSVDKSTCPLGGIRCSGMTF